MKCIEGANTIISKLWTESGLNSETQTDGYNCGIYVIFNVFRILVWYEKDIDTQIVNADYRRCTYHLEVSDALIYPKTLNKTCGICSTPVDVIDNSEIEISEYMCSTCLELIQKEDLNAFDTISKPLMDNPKLYVNEISDKNAYQTVNEYDTFKKKTR